MSEGESDPFSNNFWLTFANGDVLEVNTKNRKDFVHFMDGFRMLLGLSERCKETAEEVELLLSIGELTQEGAGRGPKSPYKMQYLSLVQPRIPSPLPSSQMEDDGLPSEMSDFTADDW